MLFSKYNLAVQAVASKDARHRRGLSGVHFSPDGSTQAMNSQMLLAVGPVDAERVTYPDVGPQFDPPEGGVTIKLDVVDQARKNIPKDSRPSTQHVAMTACSENRVEFTTVSMTKEQRVAGRPVRDAFPDWEKLLRKAGGGGRICLDRKSLIQILQAIDAACPQGGDTHPVYIEFGERTDAVSLRSVNYQTGQHTVGCVQPLDAGEDWIKLDKWESKILQKSAKRKRVG